MPAPIPPEIALRDNLRDTVAYALGLNLQLEAVIAVKRKQPSGVFHGKIDHSQPPWAASAANAIMDLHAISRDLEYNLRYTSGLPSRRRGGSSANTAKALEAVCRIAENLPDDRVRDTSLELKRWAGRAKIALGVTEPPARIPRPPGGKEPICPWCENHTLRMLPAHGIIKCVTPGCADEEGRKPSAKLEYSSHVGDFVLLWMDGLTGVPTA
jgi:hypothetical protein